MQILIVTPSARGSRTGNQITAVRWGSILRDLGHRTSIARSYDGQTCDLMIGLHARKSASSIRRFRQDNVNRPCLVALTGTDLYGDLGNSDLADQSLKYASRAILLQPAGIERIPKRQRAKCRVIYQSSIACRRQTPLKRALEIVVSGHLRSVKDPFRAAYAVRNVAGGSRLRVTHVGAALNERMRRIAVEETKRNPRYRWLGDVPHWRSRQLIARGQVLVLSSKMEGGASVIAEALVNGTPVIASNISGNRGMLGDDYPGLYAVGDTRALRALLSRFEGDSKYARQLKRHCRARAGQHSTAAERRSWRNLIAEFK